MGFAEIPREIIVTADSKGAFFGTLPPRLRGAEPPGGKKVRKNLCKLTFDFSPAERKYEKETRNNVPRIKSRVLKRACHLRLMQCGDLLPIAEKSPLFRLFWNTLHFSITFPHPVENPVENYGKPIEIRRKLPPKAYFPFISRRFLSL